jgi:hypothetical protein
MSRIAIALGVLLALGPAGAEEHKPDYVPDTYGKGAIARAAGRAAFNQIRRSPKEWPRNAAGFGKRLASGMATHVVKSSIQFGVAAARHEDLSYHRSEETRFAPRLEHALVSVVITKKTTTGKKTAASGRISGALGSGMISRAWMPASARTVAAGFTSAGIALAGDAAVNVAREFWPRHKPK